MNRLEKAKKINEIIAPLMSYNLMAEQSVNGKVTEQKKAGHYRWYTTVMASVVAVFVICVIMLTTFPAVALAAYEIPVTSDTARVFTLREYHLTGTLYDIQVEMPNIRNTGDIALEKRVNAQIQNKINQIEEKAKLLEKEMIEDQLKAGGKVEDLIPFYVIINYEVKSSNENTLSFVINDIETFASVYTYQTFFNIDLKTHKDITLSGKLGKNYSKIIVDSIQKQIAQRIQENPDLMYTVTEADLKKMVKDMKFYINDAGNVVISFDKDEIAPPPMGIQDFEIIK